MKAQLLDGKGISVERIHYANQLAFIVLKAIAFDQRGANKNVGDLFHVLQYGSDLDEGARAFADQFKQGTHRAALESALDCLRRSFCAHGDREGQFLKGSVAYGRFHKPDNVDERLQLQLQASAFVEMFVKLVQSQRRAPNQFAPAHYKNQLITRPHAVGPVRFGAKLVRLPYLAAKVLAT